MDLSALFAGISHFTTMDKIKVYIVFGFSILVGLAFVAALGMMIYSAVKEPPSDSGIWLNIFLTCLGYIVGILTGLLGIPSVPPPSSGQKS